MHAIALLASDASWTDLAPLFHAAHLTARRQNGASISCTVVVHSPPDFDALAQLAALGPPAHWRAPVVVLADDPDRELRRAALRAGASDVLDRVTVTPPQLEDALDDAIARFRGRVDPGRIDQREGFTQRVIDSLFAFVAVLDVDGALISVNAPPLVIGGVALDEVRGQKFWDCPWWSHASDVRERLRDACIRASSGETVRYEETARIAGDGRMLIDFQIAPLRDDAGRITHLVPSAIDITERRRTELELRQSEARLRRVFETNLLGIITWDLNGRIHEANDEFLRIVGYTREDLRSGRIDWARMTPAEHSAQDARAVLELRETGKHAPIEKEYIRKDDTRVWILVGSAMLDDERGVGFVLDISSQKQVETALRSSEERAHAAADDAVRERRLLDAILEAAPVGIIVANATGKLLRFNPANELLWGPAPFSNDVEEYREWKGWWADGSERHGRRVEPHEWAMARALRGDTVRRDVVEIEPFDRPGTRRTMLNSGAPVRDDSGAIVGAIIAQMDVSELVATESALRESETRFRALADNIAQLAWMTDETGYIHWYNRRWFEFTGTTLEDMKGWGWQSVHHPEHIARVTEKFQQHLASGEPWEDTFPLRRHDGEYRWFLSRAFPLRDGAGRITSWFGTNTDITAQREAEDALREADRRKDEFIAILAHELRNPLGPVRHAVELLRRPGTPQPAVTRARDAIDRQVSHMARLIDDLLDVSRISRGKLAMQMQRCDLATIVRQVADDYRVTFDAGGVALAVIEPPEELAVDADPVRLAQMVGNLLHNAARFTPEGGHVEVRIEHADAIARVEVVDSGIGIQPGLLARLFDPFSQGEQDLARSKGGLGLGLALTKGLAELHGGRVSAQSAGTGGGATFTLELPLVAVAARADAEASPPESHHDRLRILVVEDNEDAAETLAALLELGGHEVRIALDGEAALRIAREQRPHVIVSDLGLPGMDGYELGRRLRAEPAVASACMIALSGYASEEARGRSREAGFELHLAKPVKFQVLEQTLHDVHARVAPHAR